MKSVKEIMGDQPTTENLRTLMFSCPDHGSFKSIEHNPGTVFCLWSMCPECISEDKDRKKAFDSERLQKAQRAMLTERLSGAGIPVRFHNSSFDTFECADDHQRAVLQQCRDYVAAFPGKGGQGLFLCGGVGTGKSHIGVAMIIDLIHRHVKATACYTSVMKMLREIRATYRPRSEESEQEAIDRFTDYEFLVLDEVGVQLGTDAEKLLLFEVINGRYESSRPTVIVSNLNVKEIRGYIGDRVVDRLKQNGGNVVKLTWGSYRETNQDTTVMIERDDEHRGSGDKCHNGHTFFGFCRECITEAKVKYDAIFGEFLPVQQDSND